MSLPVLLSFLIGPLFFHRLALATPAAHGGGTEPASKSENSQVVSKGCAEEVSDLKETVKRWIPKPAEDLDRVPPVSESEKNKIENSLQILRESDDSRPDDPSVSKAVSILSEEKAVAGLSAAARDFLDRDVIGEQKNEEGKRRQTMKLNLLTSILGESKTSRRKEVRKILAQTFLKIYLEAPVRPSGTARGHLESMDPKNIAEAIGGYVVGPKTNREKWGALQKKYEAAPAKATVAEAEPKWREFLTTLKAIRELKKRRQESPSSENAALDAASSLLEEVEKFGSYQCVEGEWITLRQELRDAFFSKPGLWQADNLDRLNGKGTAETAAVLERGDFSKLSSLAREYFYAPAGMRAQLFQAIHLLDEKEPLLAAAYLEDLEKTLALLIPASHGDLQKELKELERKVAVVGALVYREADDSERREASLILLSKVEVRDLEAMGLAQPALSHALACVKAGSREALLNDYVRATSPGHRQEPAVREALRTNGSYLRRYFEKSGPLATQAIRRHFDPALFDANALKMLVDSEDLRIPSDLKTAKVSCNNLAGKIIEYFGAVNGLYWKQLTGAEPARFYGRLLAHNRGSDLRSFAVDSLLVLGAQAAPAAPEIAQVLSELENEPQLSALGILENVGPAAAPAVPTLLDFLRPPLPQEAASLGAADSSKKEYLARAAILSVGEKAVPALVAALSGKEKDPRVREKVVDLLYQMKEKAGGAAPALLAAAHSDSDQAVRSGAWVALGVVGEKAVPLLIEPFSSGMPGEFLPAGKALRSLKKNAVPALVKLLGTSEGELRIRTIEVLRGIGEEAGPTAAPALIPFLTSSDQKLRMATLEALSEMGRASAPAIAEFVAILKDQKESNDAHRLAARALIFTEEEKGLTPVLEFVAQNKCDRDTKAEILALLGYLGEKAAPATPLLITVLSDPKSSDDEKLIAIGSLYAIGKKAKAAIPALREIQSKSGSKDVRDHAEKTIKELEAEK